MSQSRKKRYGRILTEKELEEINQFLVESVTGYARDHVEREQKLLELFKEKGPEEFVWWVASLIDGSTESKFAPDPRYYPELEKRLEQTRQNGWPTEELKASRIEGIARPPHLRFELPMNANIKEYLNAMLAYQSYFQSLQKPHTVVEYIVDEHGRGRMYKELADELNDAITAWAEGKGTSLDVLGLDAFLKSKGYTPIDYEPYDEEKVRRMVKYYWTRK